MHINHIQIILRSTTLNNQNNTSIIYSKNHSFPILQLFHFREWIAAACLNWVMQIKKQNFFPTELSVLFNFSWIIMSIKTFIPCEETVFILHKLMFSSFPEFDSLHISVEDRPQICYWLRLSDMLNVNVAKRAKRKEGNSKNETYQIMIIAVKSFG